MAASTLRLRELFCTTTNIVPELTHEGAVIVLDLPVKEHAEIGQLSQTLFKYIWQRASERRDVRRHRTGRARVQGRRVASCRAGCERKNNCSDQQCA